MPSVGLQATMDPAEWLLTKSERGNAQTVLDAGHVGEKAWSSGNFVRPLVHGATYFSELAQRIGETQAGDAIYFTDWRGDPDERLTDDPNSEIEELLSEADIRGVDVRGLAWRSHWDRLSFSSAENRHLIEALQANDAEALLDMRVRTGGSHHQKMVVIRYQGRPERDIAYVGGIDLCHARRDDARHLGDPQPQSMAEVYGKTPPWHDAQAAITGPAVYDVETVFRERWLDPTPLRGPVRRLRDRLAGDDTSPEPVARPGGSAPAGARRNPSRAAAPHLPQPAARPRLPVRSWRGTQRGPGLQQGAGPSPAAGLHRGSVPLVA